MAGFQSALLCVCVLLAVGPICCQEGSRPYVRSFPQWLTGLIAVSVFLFIVLILFVVNRIWCGRNQQNTLPAIAEKKANGIEEVISNGVEGRYSKINQFRSKEHENAYENKVEADVVVMTTPL